MAEDDRLVQIRSSPKAGIAHQRHPGKIKAKLQAGPEGEAERPAPRGGARSPIGKPSHCEPGARAAETALSLGLLKKP